MEESGRSVGSSEVVVKNRNSSGCLIVRRKGDALAGGQGASDSRKVYMSKKEKKRRRMLMGDSGSSDEMLAAPRRRVGPETIRVCNDLNAFRKEDAEESEFGKKRERSERNGDGFFDNNGIGENERKRSKLGVFDFDEYDSVDGGRMQSPYYDESGVAFGERRFLGSTHLGRKIDRDFEAGSSRHMVEKQRNEYFERMSSVNRGHSSGRIRVESNREGFSLRDKHGGSSDQAIRLQGKNGVLKVMVNKKKVVGGPLDKYKFHKAEEHPKGPRAEDIIKKNVAAPPFYPEEKIPKKPGGYAIGSEKKLVNSRKSFPAKNNKSSNWESEDSDASLKPEPETVVRSSKKVNVEKDYTPCEKVTPNTPKDGKVRRGSGTEKQKLRERIRGMLMDAGWTIDYRPRRNRDYLDAVYINPSGTAYWSIIKAYEALQKQVNEEDNEPKPSADGSSLKLIANEDLSQLTRKTRKKIEQEMKRKRRDGSDSEDAKETRGRSTSKKHDSESMDSASHDDKLSSFMKQGGKSFKSRMNENGFASVNSNGRNSHDIGERPDSGSNSPLLHGRKSRKFGRCTLLVRSSNKGLNSETDGFVPYTGKRTILSWLVDSGTVQLSQKVQYKNRRRSRVFLEGWITRDGIHCSCCSKILTVSKFEIHAASKLRQPYQNIVLDSGVSLIQCQVDAWDRQDGSEHDGFHSVVVDGGDDHNDDTCGICGDGGELICCDGCPSTFHQSCLDIKMPPPGDWHCPNCTCKFCGIATKTLTDEDDTASTLHSCSLCEKKYHESCVEDRESSSDDSGEADQYFCGLKCKELSEQLQKYSDTKHELEGGFSWSLIRRMDHRMIPQRVECNSKLAVALTVMDECFMPVFDRRSRINIIRSVLYNCGSNFNRLNYSGFYTAILEKGDEIICAASLRFHGNKLAEMPFIGTRHIYRRQGMCRRLFSVIESALCSLKVEKLVIPAISELTQTWTEVFGFTPLEEALKREMRSMNMLVFPGIDMLQKIIGDQEHGANILTNKDAKHIECEDEQSSEPEVAAKPDIGSLTESDPKGCDNTDLSHHLNETTTEEVAARVEPVSVDNTVGSVKQEIDSSTKSDSQGRDDNTDLNHYPKMEAIAVESGFEGAEMSDKKLGASSIHADSVPIGGAGISETTTVCENGSPLKVTHDDVVTENKPLPEIVLEDTVVASISSSISQKLENPDPINNRNVCSASDSSSGRAKLVSETSSDLKNMSTPPELYHDDGVVMGNEASVSSEVSQKIENPDPINVVPGNEPFALSDLPPEIENQDPTDNGPVSTDSPSRAEISETKSPSETIQDDDAGIEKNPGRDLIVEPKPESW